jgi:hypothetical protein
MTSEETKKLVWNGIKKEKSFESNITNVIHNPNFWIKFLKWFQYHDITAFSKENHSLIGFKNFTLDLKSMNVKKKSINNHCLQSVQTDFSYTFPNEISLNFFMEISSNNIFTLNILRALLKIAIIDNQDLEIIFYLVGVPSSVKTILFRYLKFLTFGNSADLDLTFWATNTEKLKGHGASFFFFQNCDHSSFTKKNTSDLKKLCSNVPIQVGNSSTIIKGAQIFMSANNKLTSEQAPFLFNDDQWKQKLLVLPISQGKTLFGKNTAKSENIYKNLVENTAGIIAWALALPDECLVEISNNGAILSKALEIGVYEDDFDSLVLQFFVSRVRLDSSRFVPAGHGYNEQTDSLQYALVKFFEEREEVIPKGRFVIQNAFLKALQALDLMNKVKIKRRAGGWIYQGLTLSTNFGIGIKSPIPKVIYLLKETPICIAANKNFEIKPFKFKGCSTNQDIVKSLEEF